MLFVYALVLLLLPMLCLIPLSSKRLVFASRGQGRTMGTCAPAELCLTLASQEAWVAAESCPMAEILQRVCGISRKCSDG